MDIQKEISLGESLYEMIKIFIEIELDYRKKTGEYIDSDLGNLIESMNKQELNLYLNLNEEK